VSKQYKTPAE